MMAEHLYEVNQPQVEPLAKAEKVRRFLTPTPPYVEEI